MRPLAKLVLTAEQEALFAPGDVESASHFRSWTRDGAVLRRSEHGPTGIERPARPGRDTRIHRRTRDGYRESYQFTECGDCVLAGRPLAAFERAQNDLAITLLAAGGTLLALGLGGGWWITSRAIKPVDPLRIGLVVTNLHDNAVHYNHPGGRVRVRTAATNGAAILSVSNTSDGIPEEELPHIFERFYRADKARSRAQGRSGLGLAISKAIVEAHGGSIAAENESEQTVCFTVQLPNVRPPTT